MRQSDRYRFEVAVNNSLIVQQPQTVHQRSSQSLDNQHHEALEAVPLNYLIEIRPAVYVQHVNRQ